MSLLDQISRINKKDSKARKGDPAHPWKIRKALAVMIGIMSFRLDDPVPIVITEDEGTGAVEFLDTCRNLMSDDSLIELSDKNKKTAAGNNLAKEKLLPRSYFTFEKGKKPLCFGSD